MNPDLKRLCEAAWKAETEGLYCDHLGEASVDDACDLDCARYEAIVRAVLMALREPIEELAEKVGWPFTVNPDYDGCLGPSGVEMVLEDVVNFILAEPTSA